VCSACLHSFNAFFANIYKSLTLSSNYWKLKSVSAKLIVGLLQKKNYIIIHLLRIRPCGLFQFRITLEIMNHRHMVGHLGRVISSSQGLLPTQDNTTKKTWTNIHALSGIGTRNPVYERSRPAPQTARPLDWHIIIIPCISLNFHHIKMFRNDVLLFRTTDQTCGSPSNPAPSAIMRPF
jgi:hypothetical protein